MDRKDIIELEQMLFDEGAKPKALALSLLKNITNGFSDDNYIGHGGFAVVYKGKLDNGMVAVKKMRRTLDIDEIQFSKEVCCLMKAKNKNIVRFLGYCSDTQGEMVDFEGKPVMGDVRERLLCFEYLSQGSLDKQIKDASCGLEWIKRYKIITGICDGLYYLHQKRILHLDVKPGNILLDDNMMPKLADFGLSRFFSEDKSRTITSKLIGTVGYMAPEIIRENQITFKSDIYSLGIIIIEMLTGKKGHPKIDNVLESWRSRLDKTQGGAQLVQVLVCTEIGIQCTDSDPVKRPDAQHIVDLLGATKNVDESATEAGASSSSLVAQAAIAPAVPTIRLEDTMVNEHVTDVQETASGVEETLIKGRTEENQENSGFFSENIGGIGKTTLAQLILSDSQFAGQHSGVGLCVPESRFE